MRNQGFGASVAVLGTDIDKFKMAAVATGYQLRCR